MGKDSAPQRKVATYGVVSIAFLLRGRAGTYTRTHFSQTVEDSVQHDEEGEYTLDGLKGTSNDEAKDGPEEETKGHGLLAADAVHEKATDQGTREVEAVDDGAVADVLHKSVVGVQRSDNGRAEDSKGVGLFRPCQSPDCQNHPKSRVTYHKVIHEPRKRSAKHGDPIALDDEPIRHLALHGVLAVLGRVDEAQAEEQQADGQNEAEAKADTPDSVTEVLVVGSQDNEHNNTSDDEAKVNGKVGGDGVEHTTAAADILRLIASLGTAGTASRVLAWEKPQLVTSRGRVYIAHVGESQATHLQLQILQHHDQ